MKQTTREREERSYEVIDLKAHPDPRWDRSGGVIPRETIQDIIAAAGGTNEITIRRMFDVLEDRQESCRIYEGEYGERFDHSTCVYFNAESADEVLAFEGVAWQPELRF